MSKIKSKRLNNALKHSIVNNAIEWKFGKEEKKTIAACDALSILLYNHFYSKDLKKQISLLDDWMIPHKNASYFTIGTDIGRQCCKARKLEVNYWYHNIYLHFPKGTTPHLLQHNIPDDIFMTIKDKHPALYDLCAIAISDYIVVAQRIEQFRSKLKQLMTQVTTTKKLIELLPEAEKWIPEIYGCNDLPQADTVAQLLDI